MRLHELNWVTVIDQGIYAEVPFGSYVIFTDQEERKSFVTASFNVNLRMECADYEEGKVKAAEDFRKRVAELFVKIPWIKVRLREVEPGYCKEIWETEPMPNGSVLRVARMPNEKIRWYQLRETYADFKEVDEPIRKNLIFILCDENWNELFRESNDRELYPESYDYPLPGR